MGSCPGSIQQPLLGTMFEPRLIWRKQNWFALNDITDVSDTAIEVIPDYLDRSLSEAEWAGKEDCYGGNAS